MSAAGAVHGRPAFAASSNGRRSKRRIGLSVRSAATILSEGKLDWRMIEPNTTMGREEIAAFSASLKKLRDGVDDFNCQLAGIDGAGMRLGLVRRFVRFPEA